MTFLVPRFTLGDLDLTEYPFMVEWGTDYGAPQNVYEVMQSLMADGEDVRSSRSSNRTVALTVVIEGSDLLETSESERLLLLECEKARNVLTVDPGDGYAEVGAFQTFRAQVVHVPNEDMEAATLRRYRLTLQALPFVRAVEPVTATLTYGSDAGTSLDDGSSTTGWSSTDGAVTAVTVNTETAIKLTASVGPFQELTLSRTTLALTAAKPYIAVDVAGLLGTTTDSNSIDTAYVTLGSTQLGPPVAAELNPTTGFTRFFYAHTLAGTSQTLKVVIRPSWFGANAVYVGNVRAYSTAPGTGLMVADVEGSERAPMTVALSKTAAGNLGETFIYSDPTMLEYGWNPSDPDTWPNAPAGSYIAVASTAGLSNHIYTLTINDQPSSTRGGVGSARFWDFTLGTRRDGTLGTITTGWDDQWTGSGSGSSIPDFMLFRDEPGVTSLIHLSNVLHRYLFVDSPTLEVPRIGIWGGSAADGSNAVSLLSVAESLDPLTVKPPRYALFIKAAVTDVGATLTYYPQFHTFVAAPGTVS